MPEYCRHCHAEIDHLDYSCNYTENGIETGSCDLNTDNPDCCNRDCDNSDDEDYEYTCPMCNHCFDPSEDVLDELPESITEEVMVPPCPAPVFQHDPNGRSWRPLGPSTEEILDRARRIGASLTEFQIAAMNENSCRQLDATEETDGTDSTVTSSLTSAMLISKKPLPEEGALAVRCPSCGCINNPPVEETDEEDWCWDVENEERKIRSLICTNCAETIIY